jgi:hypothetical protein
LPQCWLFLGLWRRGIRVLFAAVLGAGLARLSGRDGRWSPRSGVSVRAQTLAASFCCGSRALKERVDVWGRAVVDPRPGVKRDSTGWSEREPRSCLNLVNLTAEPVNRTFTTD